MRKLNEYESKLMTELSEGHPEIEQMLTELWGSQDEASEPNSELIRRNWRLAMYTSIVAIVMLIVGDLSTVKFIQNFESVGLFYAFLWCIFLGCMTYSVVQSIQNTHKFSLERVRWLTSYNLFDNGFINAFILTHFAMLIGLIYTSHFIWALIFLVVLAAFFVAIVSLTGETDSDLDKIKKAHESKSLQEQ